MTANKGNALTIFKKTVLGFDPAQVWEYIAEQEENLKRASQIFEEKLSEMKNTVALTIREKEAYVQSAEETKQHLENYVIKCNEYQKKLSYNQEISQIAESLKKENQALKEELQSNSDRIAHVDSMHNEIMDLRAKCDFYEEEQRLLIQRMEVLKQQHQEMTDEFLEENRSLQQQMSQRKTLVCQGVKQHKYNLKKVMGLVADLQETLSQTSESFGNLEE